MAPESVQESVDLAYGAFDLAEKYRHPVLIATDATIGQMIEPVELPPMKEHDIDTYDWALKPREEGEPGSAAAEAALIRAFSRCAGTARQFRIHNS